MTSATMTGFMISLVIVSLFAAVLVIGFSEYSDRYGVEFNNQSVAKYNKLKQLYGNATAVQDKTKIEESGNKLTDIIGGYFAAGYQALYLTAGSFATFEGLTNDAISDSNLGAVATPLRIAIKTIVIILIFVGIFIAAIVKSDI